MSTFRLFNTRAATLHVSPGMTAEKLVNVERGRDLIILEQTNMDNQPWLKVYVTIPQEERAPREITGWLTAKGVVMASTPNGDQIIGKGLERITANGEPAETVFKDVADQLDTEKQPVLRALKDLGEA